MKLKLPMELKHPQGLSLILFFYYFFTSLKNSHMYLYSFKLTHVTCKHSEECSQLTLWPLQVTVLSNV